MYVLSHVTCEMITRITHTIRSLQSNTQITNYLSNPNLLITVTVLVFGNLSEEMVA